MSCRARLVYEPGTTRPAGLVQSVHTPYRDLECRGFASPKGAHDVRGMPVGCMALGERLGSLQPRSRRQTFEAFIGRIGRSAA